MIKGHCCHICKTSLGPLSLPPNSLLRWEWTISNVVFIMLHFALCRTYESWEWQNNYVSDFVMLFRFRFKPHFLSSRFSVLFLIFFSIHLLFSLFFFPISLFIFFSFPFLSSRFFFFFSFFFLSLARRRGLETRATSGPFNFTTVFSPPVKGEGFVERRVCSQCLCSSGYFLRKGSGGLNENAQFAYVCKHIHTHTRINAYAQIRKHKRTRKHTHIHTKKYKYT